MTFLETVKAMPEADRLAFYRALLEMSEAGRKAGMTPKALSDLYTGVVREVSDSTDAPALRVHKESSRVVKMALEKLEKT